MAEKMFVAIAATALSLAGCDRGGAPAADAAQTADTQTAAAASPADTDAVKKLETEFLAAIESKNFDFVKASYAADAMMVLPNMAPMKGAAAIAADYDKFAADPAGKFDATNESTVVGADMAYSQGQYAVTYTNDKTKAVENGQGHYLLVYRKQPDGSWKIVHDFNSPAPKAG